MIASAMVQNIAILGNACVLISLICVAAELVRENTVRILRRHN